LSPVQIVLIPLFDENNEEKVISFCKEINLELKKIIRSEIWKEKRLNYRIRKIHQKKIPSYIVIGEKEISSDQFDLSYNYDNDSIKLTKNQLIEMLNKLNKEG